MGKIAKIPLTQGKHAIVDAEDEARILAIGKWYAFKGGKTFYAVRHEGDHHLFMHRILAETPDGFVTDHLNGNGLDNRRSNLRNCTHAQNLANRTRLQTNNTSNSTGVSWDKVNKKWEVRIKRNQKSIFLGRFKKKVEAVKARVSFIENEYAF